MGKKSVTSVSSETELEKAKRKASQLRKEIKGWIKECRECDTELKKYKEAYQRLYSENQLVLKLLIDQEKRETERSKEKYEQVLKKLNRNIKLHVLYEKGMIETPCAACQLNGNCNFQNLYKGEVIRTCPTVGPFPAREGEVRKIMELKIGLVDQEQNEDLLN